jgi:hypothetical protein
MLTGFCDILAAFTQQKIRDGPAFMLWMFPAGAIAVIYKAKEAVPFLANICP